MKSIWVRSLLCLGLLAIAGWAGFHLWLSRQPEDFQQQVNELNTAQFWGAVYQMIFPQPYADLASFQRVDYEGRGHSPWVLRSSLDGQPRMLSIAVTPDHWLSYSTERGAPYQLWQGALDFRGPVYGTGDGLSPTSQGQAYFQETVPVVWRLASAAGWRPASVQFTGYHYRVGGNELALEFELSDGEHRLSLLETPSVQVSNAGIQLVREFRVLRNPARLSPVLRVPAGAVSTAGGDEVDPLWHKLSNKAVLVQRFDQPLLSLRNDEVVHTDGGAPAEERMASSDCLSCHNPSEKVVGPSWREIANRYRGRGGMTATLAERVVAGSSGHWGIVPMPPHPELSNDDARVMVSHILETPDESEPLPDSVKAIRERYSHTYDAIEPNKPEALHPALTITSLLHDGFTPQVGGLALAENGDLLVATWDRDGAVYRLKNWQGGAPATVTRIAEGLQEALGMAVVEGRLYVMQKQEITELEDRDGDGLIDFYRVTSNDWPATDNFHEFGFGLAAKGDRLYGALSVCVLLGGKSCPAQVPERGSVFSLDLDTGERETLATGLRTPNGLALNGGGELFVTDNQGDWVPSSKLIHVRRGGSYGVGGGESLPPALWLPQNEIGNSPSEPLFPISGPYRGQVFFGDIYNGGLKRAYLEKVKGQYQGAVFHFSDGLSAPVNRLLETPAGIVAGEIGNPGNWGLPGRPWYGLELLQWTGKTAFEPMAISATADGFEVRFTKPLGGEGIPSEGAVKALQWFYHASSMYGGPKYDLKPLSVTAMSLSPDRKRLRFKTPGRETNRVVYFEFGPELLSDIGETLWVNQAWYTLNAIPEAGSAPKHNTLTLREKLGGWRLLFNGKDFSGWRQHNAKPREPIEGWVIEDGAMKMTRDTSFLGYVLNIINPFTDRPLLDLLTEQQFANFELSIDWKISEGGNSGIFYLVPPTDARIPWGRGLEMQVLDNEGHKDGKIRKHRAGDLYDIVASSSEPVNPVGEWNRARVRVLGDRVQHWLNGVKVVDIRRTGSEWDAMLAESKFSDTPQHGQAPQGHILLQDHGDTVWYRNVKIRELSVADQPRLPPADEAR